MNNRNRAVACATVLVGITLACATAALGQSEPPASSIPGVNAVHIVVGGGPMAGTYDLTRPELCSVGFVSDDDWFFSYSDETATPSDVTVDVSNGSSLDFFSVGFGSGGSDPAYTGVAEAPTIDDQGNAGSIAAAGPSTFRSLDGTEGDGGQVEIQVTCSGITRLEGTLPSGPATSPGPEQSAGPAGSPPSGSTTFHVELRGGPKAGTYDIWTVAPDACIAGAAGPEDWALSFSDETATPTDIQVVINRGEPLADPELEREREREREAEEARRAAASVSPGVEPSGELTPGEEEPGEEERINALAISFGGDGNDVVYLNTDEESEAEIEDEGQTAHVDAEWRGSQAVTADGSLVDGGAARITVQCGTVQREPGP